MVKLNIEMRTLIDPEEGLIEITLPQYHALLDAAQRMGHDTLRGLHWSLKRHDTYYWSYYDVLKDESP